MNAPRHIRLLMLEDNPRDAELIERHLRRALSDCSFTLVDREDAFRSALETSGPDVILSDHGLPNFDGVSALRIARVLAPSIPFIFVSGSIGEERAVEALREGATDYVLKDRLSRLGPAILRALDERRERSLRHSIENALRVSEQRFQYAAAATREVIWDWDLAASRIWFSDALRDYWGYDLPHGEVQVSWFSQRIHGEDRAEAMASLREALAEKERWTAEVRLLRGDGIFGFALIRGIIVRDDSGEPVRVIGAILDVTERRQLEQQLDQARRVESLGRVAATVAHEFNNVLMCILPLTEVIRRASDNVSIIESTTGRIAEAIARGRRLTEQILRFGRPAEPALVPIELGQWLTRLTPELTALAGPCATVVVTASESSLPVCIDPPQMLQVLSNLVVNARDAMPASGTIRVHATMDGEHALLSVSDDGTGMPPDVLERIFEPLFTTKRYGTGLGLAVAQQVVARHRGSIDVTSSMGKGTTFRISLPVESHAQAALPVIV